MKYTVKLRFDDNGRPVIVNAPERVRNPNEPGTSITFKRRRQSLAKSIVKHFKQMNKDSSKRHEERIKLMRESLELQRMQLEKMCEMVQKLTAFFEKAEDKQPKPEPGTSRTEDVVNDESARIE